MKEPSAEIRAKLHELKEDKPYDIELGGKTYKVKYLKDKTVELMSYQQLKFEGEIPSSIGEAIELAKSQKGALAQCVSYLLLNSYWKINLFHWAYWRYLSWSMNRRTLASGVIYALIAMDMSSFIVALEFLRANSSLTMKKTKEEVEQLQAEQS